MLMVAEVDVPAVVTNTKVADMMTPGGLRPIKARRNTGHFIVAAGSSNRRSEADRCSERY